mmetsp:Transcript_38167/g.106291  ORF Transcript_38167/g.106291 Transcript_38167/m.106291 type:complete len:279 (+) Transcript_38167:180-1016(+)
MYRGAAARLCGLPLPLLGHALSDELEVEHLGELVPADHRRALVQGGQLCLFVDGLVDVAVKPAECGLQVPVGETETVRQGYGIWADLLEEPIDPGKNGVRVGQQAQKVPRILVNQLQRDELVEPQQCIAQRPLLGLLEDHVVVVPRKGVDRVALGGPEGQHHDLVQRLVKCRAPRHLGCKARLKLLCKAARPVPQQPQQQRAHRGRQRPRPQRAATLAELFGPHRRLPHVRHGAHWRQVPAHLSHSLHQEPRGLQRQDHMLAFCCHGLGGCLRQVAHA